MTSRVRARLGGLLLVVLALNGAAAAPLIAQPATSIVVPASFDCGKATRAVDRFICANAALRWQDLALSRNYRATRDALTGPARAALLAEQRDWLSERDRRCVANRRFAELSPPSSELHDQPYAVSADFGTMIWSTHNHCGDEYLTEPDMSAPQRFCLATMVGAKT